MTEQKNKGVVMALEMRIPWEGLKVGQSVFLPGANKSHAPAIRTAASRRKISASVKEVVEKGGPGLRVTIR